MKDLKNNLTTSGKGSTNIQSRRGIVKGMQLRNDAQVLDCEVPLREMFGYATDLRSMTQGRALFTMQFSYYSKVPQSIEKQIIDAYALLGNDEDKELFYSYLVTNLKLYFDKFDGARAQIWPKIQKMRFFFAIFRILP